MRNLMFSVLITIALTSLNGFADKMTTGNTEKYPSLVVEFPKNRHDVSETMKNDVRNFIAKARAGEKINEVYVAAWADKPLVGDRSLTDADQKLARDRARNLRKFLEDEFNVDVDTFNMAKRTDFWTQLFHPEEARVKGQKPIGHDRIAWKIQEEGKPTAAVLVVEPERRNLSE